VAFGNQLILFHELPMTDMQHDNASYQAMLNWIIDANPDWTFFEGCNFFVKID
jgi:hypothetical protein